VTSSHQPVNRAGKSARPENWVGLAAMVAGCVAQPWQRRTQVQSITGMKKHAYICKSMTSLDIMLKIAQ